MAEEFQGGVCGGTWWNPPWSLFTGGGAAGLTSPCSVAQLGGGGGFDMGTFGWTNEELIIKSNNNKANNVYDNNFDNSLVFQADLDCTLDMLGFGLSPTTSTTTDWSQPNLLINGGGNDVNYGSIFLEDENLKTNSSNIMNSNNISSYDHNIMNNCNNSPPMAVSGDSSTITSEGGLITNSSFQMSSSASYLIQTLFDDTNDSQVLEPQLPNSQPVINSNYERCVMDSSHELMSSPNISPIQHSLQLGQTNELHGGINGQYSTGTALSNIRASLLNSLKSRSRAPTQSCAHLGTNKVNMEVRRYDSKGNLNDQPPTKRPRIETPSSLPTFKVRKEKLGDRITALQQLVSPFGKTDTASVLHEAIEYIKFLHDQVNALSTPYLKNNGAPMQHHQENEEANVDLRSRGLCVVPISSTYPVVQETSVDFWTPTFGGPEFT